MTSEMELRRYLRMSLEQLRAEGAEFCDAYLADCEAVVRGEMTEEVLRGRHIDRVVAAAGSLPSRHDLAGQAADGRGDALIKTIRSGVAASRLRELLVARSRAAGGTP